MIVICNSIDSYLRTVPQVEIRGAPDIYVMSGSGVTLHCVISGLIDTPPYIFWYHKTERIAGSALEDNAHHSAGHGHPDGGKEPAAWLFSAPSASHIFPVSPCAFISPNEISMRCN